MIPTDPRWQPDPSGQRLRTIRVVRRAAVLAAVLFAPIVGLGLVIGPPETLGAPNGAALFGLVMSLPGIALLGAALAPATLGSRASAASAGVALGVGIPIAAVISAMLSVWVVLGMLIGHDKAGVIAGMILRDGVTTAVKLSPLVVLACLVWVRLVRRWGAASGSTGSVEATDLVTEPDRSWLLDLAPDPEHEVLPVDEAPVVLDRPERVEVAGAGVGVVRGHRAAGDGGADADDGTPKSDARPSPGVLLVGLPAGELDQHPEPSGIDAAHAEDRAERIE
jgi:hypothetical protein